MASPSQHYLLVQVVPYWYRWSRREGCPGWWLGRDVDLIVEANGPDDARTWRVQGSLSDDPFAVDREDVRAAGLEMVFRVIEAA